MKRFFILTPLLIMALAPMACKSKTDLAKVIRYIESTKATAWAGAQIAAKFQCQNGKNVDWFLDFGMALEALTEIENAAINAHNAGGDTSAWVAELLPAMAGVIARFNANREMSTARGELNQTEIKAPQITPDNVVQSRTHINPFEYRAYVSMAQQLINGCGSG